jgi:hypothetical protein
MLKQMRAQLAQFGAPQLAHGDQQFPPQDPQHMFGARLAGQ